MSFIGSLRSRVMRSVGADALGQVLNVGIRLMLVPLLLSTWGAESYGEWLILTAIAAWFGLGDLGGQLYFVNRLTTEWVTGKLDLFQRTYSTGLLLFLASSTILFLGVLIAICFLPISDWLGIKSVNQTDVKIILLLMALRFLVALPIGLMLGVYRAIGIQATSVMYGNLMLLIQFVASAVALLNGGGMVLLAALEVLPFLLVFIVVVWDLRRRLPGKFKLFALGQADREIFRAAISPSLHFLGQQVSAAIMIQGCVLVLARSLGPVEVAIFSSMRMVANVMSRFTGILAHAAWPEITRLASLGQNEKLSKLFQAILLVSLLAGTCYVILVVNFGQLLFIWWTNNTLPYDFWIMYLLSCQVVMNVLWTWGGNLLMATNCHEEYSKLQFPVNLLALFLCNWGVINYGLLGAVVGVIVGQVFLMLVVVAWLLVKNGWRNLAWSLVVMSLSAMVVLSIVLFLRTNLLTLSLVLMVLYWRRKWLINKFNGMWI